MQRVDFQTMSQIHFRICVVQMIHLLVWPFVVAVDVVFSEEVTVAAMTFTFFSLIILYAQLAMNSFYYLSLSLSLSTRISFFLVQVNAIAPSFKSQTILWSEFYGSKTGLKSLAKEICVRC